MRGSPQNKISILISPLQSFNGLDILFSTRYNKGTKFIVCIDSQLSDCQTHFFIKFAMDSDLLRNKVIIFRSEYNYQLLFIFYNR